MLRTLALLSLIAATAFAGRAATYAATVGDQTQTLVIRRETAEIVGFTLTNRCPKARCLDSIVGEARQDPFQKPSGKGSKGDFAAEEYVYQKGKCRLTLRVDMESASMVQVIAACPERDRRKCPLSLGEVLKIKR
jgi:hypothetical protein